MRLAVGVGAVAIAIGAALSVDPAGAEPGVRVVRALTPGADASSELPEPARPEDAGPADGRDVVLSIGGDPADVMVCQVDVAGVRDLNSPVSANWRPAPLPAARTALAPDRQTLLVRIPSVPPEYRRVAFRVQSSECVPCVRDDAIPGRAYRVALMRLGTIEIDPVEWGGEGAAVVSRELWK